MLSQLAMKLTGDSMKMMREIGAGGAEVDWSVWEAKGVDADVIAKVKAITDEHLGKAQDSMDFSAYVDLDASATAAFNGPDGLVRAAPHRLACRCLIRLY